MKNMEFSSLALSGFLPASQTILIVYWKVVGINPLYGIISIGRPLDEV